MQISELLNAASAAVKGQGDRAADTYRGSDYESLYGPTAVIWTRMDRRDADLFNAGKLHTAKNYDLTFLVKERFGIDRYLDTFGSGKAVLSRPTAAGGAGTVWAGTRILAYGGSPRYYRVTEDVAVAAGAISAVLPVEYVEIGPGSKIDTLTNIRLDDVLWDSTWVVSSLKCDPGTIFEEAPAFIERVRSTRWNRRVGQRYSIEKACKDAGAGRVVILQASAGIDAGLNMVYVGDLGYSSTPTLVKDCFMALRDARVLGDHMQVLSMNRVPVNTIVDVYLASDPALNDIERLEQFHTNSIRQYFDRDGYAYTLNGIQGAIVRNTPEVQKCAIALPASDATLLSNGHLPGVLNRYVPGSIALRYHGP